MRKTDDPYAMLGLPHSASLEEVKRAYRRLAMRWHPDRNASSEAEGEFKRIKDAYELLLDPQRYRQWKDTQTQTQPPTEAHAASARPEAASADETQPLNLSLEEAARGCVKSVERVRSTRCPPCHGSGRVQHSHSVPCAHCNGIGRVRGDGRGSSLCAGCGGRGYLRETECPECSGSGWRKKLRTLSVKVPCGIVHGERLRLARQARHASDADAAAGDLYLEIRLAPHSLFELQQRDLHCTVPVSIFRLLAGGKIEVPTLNGSALLDLSPDPAHALDYRLPGHGFPRKHGRGAGDLVVHLQIVHPRLFSAKDRALLERLEASLATDLEQRAPELATWAARLSEQKAR
jgi:molecular chaperone DnaJ